MKRKPQAEVGYIAEDGWVSKHWGNINEKKYTALQAIKRQCLECMGGHEHPWQMADGEIQESYRPYKEVRECHSTWCYLWPYRMGRMPKKEGQK